MDASLTVALLAVVVAGLWIVVLAGLGATWSLWGLIDHLRGRETRAHWLQG